VMALTVSNQQYVSGTVRMKLFKGHAQVVGRKSQNSLYRHELATYEEGDQYDASAALGFIKIHGLAQTTQAKHQLLRGQGGHRLELPSIIPPSRSATGGGEPPAPDAGAGRLYPAESGHPMPSRRRDTGASDFDKQGVCGSMLSSPTAGASRQTAGPSRSAPVEIGSAG